MRGQIDRGFDLLNRPVTGLGGSTHQCLLIKLRFVSKNRFYTERILDEKKHVSAIFLVVKYALRKVNQWWPIQKSRELLFG